MFYTEPGKLARQDRETFGAEQLAPMLELSKTPADQAVSHPRAWRAWNYGVLSSYAFAIAFLWGGFLSLILPVLNKEFAPGLFGSGSTELVRGILAGTGLGLAMFVQPLSGTLSDHFQSRLGRRRPFILAGTVGAALSLLIIIAAPDWWMLAIGYLSLQISANVAQGAYQGLQPDMVAPSERSRAGAIFTVAQLAGTLAGALVPGILQSWLGGLDGSRLSLSLTALLIIVSAALTAVFIKEKSYSSNEIGHESLWHASFGMFQGLRAYPDFSWLMLQRFCFLAASASLSLFVKPFLETIGFVQTVTVNGQVESNAGFTASLLLGLVGVAAAGGAYPAARFSPRFGRKKILYAAVGAGLAGALLIELPYYWLQSATDAPEPIRNLAFGLVIVSGMLIGVGVGAFTTVSWAFATELFPSEEAGRFMGLSNFATAGSSAFAGIAGGWLVTTAWGYGGLFALTALYYLVSGLLLSRVRRH